MTDTANLGLPLIDAGQAQKHVTHNEALRAIDALAQLVVQSAANATPPDSPANGQCWIVAPGSTGAWANKAGQIAEWVDGGWYFFPPLIGWTAYDIASRALLAYDGNAWVNALSFANVAMVGVNATPDSSNRLAIKSNAAIFGWDDVSPGSGDMRITLNKSAAANDLGFTFQDDWSTRALMGLLADDNFTLKVSGDGSTFRQALSVDKGSGHVGLNGFTADANNALGVKGTAFLFDAETDHCRFTFNKTAAIHDVALTFQDGYSARALVGLLGDDNFTFKVSPDGSTYRTAFVLDKSTAAVDHTRGSKFSSYCNFGQNYPAGAWTDLAINNTRHNDQGHAAIAGNAITFTAPSAGCYLFGLMATFESGNGTPTRMDVGLSVNAAAPTPDALGSIGGVTFTSGVTMAQISVLLKLAANDTVKPKVQFTGGNGRVIANQNHFWGVRIA